MKDFELKNPDKAIYELLDKSQISYSTIQHSAGLTEEEVMAQNGLSLHQGAKSMVLKGDDSFLLVVLAGDQRLALKKAKDVLEQRKVRLATNDEIQGLMGCSIGSCYPVGRVIGLDTFADTSITDNETIFFNPGVPDRWVKMRWSDYSDLVKPKIISVAQDQ